MVLHNKATALNQIQAKDALQELPGLWQAQKILNKAALTNALSSG